MVDPAGKRHLCRARVIKFAERALSAPQAQQARSFLRRPLCSSSAHRVTRARAHLDGRRIGCSIFRSSQKYEESFYLLLSQSHTQLHYLVHDCDVYIYISIRKHQFKIWYQQLIYFNLMSSRSPNHKPLEISREVQQVTAQALMFEFSELAQ